MSGDTYGLEFRAFMGAFKLELADVGLKEKIMVFGGCRRLERKETCSILEIDIEKNEICV